MTDEAKFEAFKRRVAIQRKAQEKKDLEAANTRQPRARSLRYDNMRSAMAEESLLRMLLRQPDLFDRAQTLTREQFSVPMFGRAFDALRERWRDDLSVSPNSLSDLLTPEEMAHLTEILQKPDVVLSDEAFDDCVRIITEEYGKTQITDRSDIKAMQERLLKKKGYGGT